jgi:molybdopterin/thiamine biosynthesis adenylyltransferase
MNASDPRYDRNRLLFGKKGQEKIAQTTVAVCGVSGLGSPLVQHLALLGVGRIILIEPEELDDTNRNRFVGARSTDPVPGSPKVLLAERLVKEINPEIAVEPFRCSIVSAQAFEALGRSDWVFGCFDHDGPRFVLNELCAAFGKPYIDLASDVPEEGSYGGHICIAGFSCGCLSCRGLLDMKAVGEWLSAPEDLAVRDAIYGIDRRLLAEKKGPSVSPLNGIVASLGALEFMVAVTGLRPPKGYLNFRGHLGRLSSGVQKEPDGYCTFCETRRDPNARPYVERYLQIAHLNPPKGS